MTSGRKLDKRYLIPGLALLAVFVIGAEAPLFAQAKAKSTRSAGSNNSAPSKASSGTTSRASTGSAPRASAPSRGSTASSTARPRAANTRQSTPGSRGRYRGSGGYRSHRHHDVGLYFGYGGWGWGGYYGYGPGYYYPSYYHPFYWGVPYYVPRRAYNDYELGAFDLNVRPKKAEVYVDGQYIGKAGQFDGFPDHLWLEQGTYELIFYRPGLATERRVLSIYPGVVVDVRLRLAAGASVAPAELSQVTRSAGAAAEGRAAYRKPAVEPAPASAELDTRTTPGRVRLSVVPADASVYLDGRLLGSGDELGRLHAGLVVEAGSHLIEVVRPGYATERREFAVDEGAEVELEVLLEAG